MTWARGFLRLWIVLAVLWCGAVVAVLGRDEFKGLWRPSVSITVEFKGGATDVLDGWRPREETRRQIIEGVNKGAAKLVQRGDTTEAQKQIGNANETADELLKVIADETAKRSDRLFKALIILCAPPVTLLIFGIAAAWVVTGFRRRAV
jgi:hypothetical protein